MRLQESQTHVKAQERFVVQTKTVPPQTVQSDDVVHLRDAQWLEEMKTKLAAVEAWRGFPTHHARKPRTS